MMSFEGLDWLFPYLEGLVGLFFFLHSRKGPLMGLGHRRPDGLFLSGLRCLHCDGGAIDAGIRFVTPHRMAFGLADAFFFHSFLFLRHWTPTRARVPSAMRI